MRKLSIVLISALLVFGLSIQARAEQSTSTFTGDRYEEQQVMVYCYNNSGAEIQSNSAVIIDITATAGTTLGTYITTTTTTDSSYVFGVTDETISSGSVGRICVRGPHKVQFASEDTAAEDTVGTLTPAGKVETTTTTSNKDGILGLALAATAVTDRDYGTDMWWIWVDPYVK